MLLRRCRVGKKKCYNCNVTIKPARRGEKFPLVHYQLRVKRRIRKGLLYCCEEDVVLWQRVLPSTTAKRMDGFYGQVNAMNQIDFILAANNTAIMQPFSAGERETTIHPKKPRVSLSSLVLPFPTSACVSQKQLQNRAQHQKMH